MGQQTLSSFFRPRSLLRLDLGKEKPLQYSRIDSRILNKLPLGMGRFPSPSWLEGGKRGAQACFLLLDS